MWPLGDGMQGSVFNCEYENKLGSSAVKFFFRRDDFERELAVYHHLRKKSVEVVCGLAVPQLIASDSRYLAIEITMVKRPYLLDFAKAEFQRPDFPENVWQEWDEQLKDLFESDWPKVKKVLSALERLGIFLLDAHPGNIAFEDEA